ncbi:Fms-interacting protein-domain-containing protein [Lentinula detonsa]|uniref:Fms-interacting protein-domain-containing protein n=1 Tax=Lentinula detonsa TaxID=2804962 RepID=A0A9W8TUR7_9AGAR|nr:Fms-interacting protein-domain-containing protein [Lentinula detonsa]KAJ3985892.1 Fms-interacting protein-domain-containing protein [Lentinula detonsa]
MASDGDQIIENLRALSEPANANSDVQSLLIRSSALVSCLKSLNRAANTATKTKKDETTAARQEMDQSHLGLQNLLYEKRHLEREIEKCRQFASVYQDIPLYTLEEFQGLAPEEARTSEVLEDDHQLMLNRLSFELAERQRLDLKRRELLQAKEELLKQSKANTNTLDGVKGHIDALVKTASEIQKKVDELIQPLPVPENSTAMTIS